MPVPHRKREHVPAKHATVLITTRIAWGVPPLRQPAARELILTCLRAARARFGLRILQFAILDDHMHFVVQAPDNEALSRGMQGLLIRIARGLNRVWNRSGKVFLERFHSSVLYHYWALRRAVRYVLQNGRKHGVPLPDDRPDLYTSGPWFRGWREQHGKPFDTSEPPVSEIDGTNNLLLKTQYGILTIGLTELPGPRPDNRLFDIYPA